MEEHQQDVAHEQTAESAMTDHIWRKMRGLPTSVE